MEGRRQMQERGWDAPFGHWTKKCCGLIFGPYMPSPLSLAVVMKLWAARRTQIRALAHDILLFAAGFAHLPISKR